MSSFNLDNTNVRRPLAPANLNYRGQISGLSKNTILFDQPSANMKNDSAVSVTKQPPSDFDFLTARIGEGPPRKKEPLSPSALLNCKN
jgi:hypothetical protein